MPPDTAHQHAFSVDHLCSPPSLGPASAKPGPRRREAPGGHSRAASRAGRRSQTEGFFMRSPSEGGPTRPHAQTLTKDRADHHPGLIRAPTESDRPQRHMQFQSRLPGLRPGKEADSALGFDFATAMSQRPVVAFSGPLPRRVLGQWGEESCGATPLGFPPLLLPPGKSTSWVEGRPKQASWQDRAKRWLLLKPAARVHRRGGPGGLSSFIPMSDGALGLMLREDPCEEQSVLTPRSRKALFCPSRQSFLESVSTSTW